MRITDRGRISALLRNCAIGITIANIQTLGAAFGLAPFNPTNTLLMTVGGAVAGAMWTALRHFLPSGKRWYYLTWIVATEAGLFLFLVWGSKQYAPPIEGEPDVAAMLQDPLGIGFWLVSGALVGVFLGRLFASMDSDEQS